MKVTFSSGKGTFTASHRKERSIKSFKSFNAIVPNPLFKNTGKGVVELRLYFTNSRVYACIWIDGINYHNDGSGFSDGQYYQPAKAAISAALNAGVIISDKDQQTIDSRGDNGITDLVLAIAKAVGYPDALTFKSHQ